MQIRAIFLLVVSLLSAPVSAAENDVSIQDPYVRMVPPGVKTTGAFMLIANAGAKDITLVTAESGIAQTVQLHTHINEDGVMKMRQVAGIDVKAKGQTELKPGSFHVMLIDLKSELKEGDRVPITLTFSDGQKKTVEALVRKLPMAMPAGHDVKPDRSAQ
jgi:copper(I)-binding protein